MASRQHFELVLRGTEAIRDWREKERVNFLDLSGANLSNANLSEANLSNAQLSGADLRGADFRNADLRANLRGANLSGADLRAQLSGADLCGADLSGANLCRADLSEANLSSAILSGANLSEANLSGANLNEANLSDANLSNAQLREANLESADLRNANLRNAQLRSADLRSADLRSADLESANLESANLRNANLSGADLESANLRNTNLSRADLSGANLSGANLSGANLESVNLISADLTKIQFGYTNFANINLSELKNLEDAQHLGPSHVSTSTLRSSNGAVPGLFLQGCGFQEWEILQAKMYDPALTTSEITDIQYKIFDNRTSGPLYIGGVFISYSRNNENFVDGIYARLKKEGVPVWLDRHDVIAGDLQKQISKAIRLNDVVLLVLSEAAIQSDWVESELDMAREKEKAENRDVLCPISIDDTWKTKIENDAAGRKLWRKLTDKAVLDFSPNADFETQFSKLLRGLKINYPK